MDNKIIQLIIQSIVESDEYSLEGIALYTRIPLDVIYDVACGIKNECSAVLWTRIVDLFIQVKPEIAHALFDRLIEIIKNPSGFSHLLNET